MEVGKVVLATIILNGSFGKWVHHNEVDMRDSKGQSGFKV